jgi:hypothetical protein
MQQHGSNRRRESRLLIGLAWLLKLKMMADVDIATQGFLGRYQYIKKKKVLGFKFLGFLGDGFGVKGRVEVWVVVLSLVCLSMTGPGEVLRPVWPAHHALCTPVWLAERTYKAKRGGKARALLKLQNSTLSGNCPFCPIYSTIGVHPVMKGYWPIIKISSRH